MAKRILVTGASGFVGSRLVAALRGRGDAVVAHSLADGDLATAPLDFDVEQVFHLAGKTFVPESWEAPLGFYAANVLGTVNVLELCRRRGARLTYVSSYVYGTPRWLPIGEDHPVEAFNPYSHTKILAEDTVRFYGERFGVQAVVIRPFNIYGPGQAGHFLIPTLVRQAVDPGCSRITVADLAPRRDHLHVDDAVELLIAASDAPGGSIYNAGSGVSVSIPELVDIINGITGALKPVEATGKSRPGEVMDVVADISKAARELNWQPRIPLTEGLRQLV